MDYTDRPGNVSDPWYTDDFDTAYRDIREGCEGLLRKLQLWWIWKKKEEAGDALDKQVEPDMEERDREMKESIEKYMQKTGIYDFNEAKEKYLTEIREKYF